MHMWKWFQNWGQNQNVITGIIEAATEENHEQKGKTQEADRKEHEVLDGRS
jgi:hypothetical protein